MILDDNTTLLDNLTLGNSISNDVIYREGVIETATFTNILSQAAISKTVYGSEGKGISTKIATNDNETIGVNLKNSRQGDLIVDSTRWQDKFYLNGDGELIVIGPNSDKYSINSDGNLIYTT